MAIKVVSIMKFYSFAFLLVGLCAYVALAEPEPEPAKASRLRAAQIIEDDIQVVDEQDQEDMEDAKKQVANKKEQDSSGRLFFRNFLFKNMFGQNQKQPVIPIIITGGGNVPATTPDTTTMTETDTPIGTISTGTDGDTGGGNDAVNGGGNDAVNGGGNGGGAGGLTGRIQFYGRQQPEGENEEIEEAPLGDEQSVAAALAAGGEEYVVTDQDIRGTSDAKALRGPARINLKSRSAKRGQVVSVRIPAKYRQYFTNGQRVILKKYNKRNGRPVKRRIIRRRPNRRRNNKNRRRRIVAA